MSIRSEKSTASARFSKWLDRLRGRTVEWDLAVYRRRLAEVDRRAGELSLAASGDDALRALALDLRKRAADGAGAGQLEIEGFALAREAAARAVGLRPNDGQMLAALALMRGRVVELATGEGKTLVAVLPAFVNALAGLGAHVLTFNDYLAKRDAAWMGPAYSLLGLTVASVAQGMSAKERRDAYRADVTYATVRELGYDFLRDRRAEAPADRVLRPFHFALVDEADSTLIDEARVPLVIAGADVRRDESDRGSADPPEGRGGAEEHRMAKRPDPPDPLGLLLLHREPAPRRGRGPRPRAGRRALPPAPPRAGPSRAARALRAAGRARRGRGQDHALSHGSRVGRSPGDRGRHPRGHPPREPGREQPLARVSQVRRLGLRGHAAKRG